MELLFLLISHIPKYAHVMIPRISFKPSTANILLRFPLPNTNKTNNSTLHPRRPIYISTGTPYHYHPISTMSSITTRSQSRASASASTSTPPLPAPTESTTSSQATAQAPTLISEHETGPVYFWREYDSPYDFLSQWYPSAFTAPGGGGGMYSLFLFFQCCCLRFICCCKIHAALSTAPVLFQGKLRKVEEG